MPGVTLANTPQRKKGALKDTMQGDGVLGIVGAARVEPAVIPKERANGVSIQGDE
jgi:hypothetical protein